MSKRSPSSEKENAPSNDPSEETPSEEIATDNEELNIETSTFPTDGSDNLEHRLHLAEKEVEDWREKALRAVAEMENNRRRLERDKEDFARYANAGLIKDLLPVVDNLTRATQASSDGTSDQAFGENLRKGVTMVAEEIHTIFGQHNVSLIETEPGETFDPQRHEAMTEIRDETLPPGSIAIVLEPGYMLFDRLLRPCRVAVNARDINAKKTGRTVDVES